MTLAACLLGFGALNIALALALALAAVFGLFSPPASGLWFYLILQMVLGAALAFCGRQIRAGKDLGHKAFPAVCVAYGLFLLMVWRWVDA
ncbi:hypothetical protein [Simiduia agarivorans]|uniref:Transmembrane protein n=1 Tax=Simiduia agarivorans (strain DSM 21679 / JCM 13881 / BCRC 17597 / SA1) TaxID=1117647 RepID=K4L257_SIMAS|nr:hypothetical protein [Simiduia agarivorans]AFV00243.1 hypothetical protein M5M_15550 [Simiduia agarivorans SA1 = DSM 21679]